jgi:hypothetical protein
MEWYVDDDNVPTFGGGSYLEPETPGGEVTSTVTQRRMEVVDSYSMSVTLCLATLGFLQILGESLESRSTQVQIVKLRDLASTRLTAAMNGLLRSFSVHVFEQDSEAGQNFLSMANQGHESDRQFAERLSRSLDAIRGRLRKELSIGITEEIAERLSNNARLFECGWSWGVVAGAEKAQFVELPQVEGYAEDRPYLYFTSVALDGIEDLFSDRTQILGLLDDQQQRLANALRLRWDLTLNFWNIVATFGGGKLPVEDVPWRTTDGMESDYYTLFIASMLVQRLANQRNESPYLLRMSRVFEDLAGRARIIRRPAKKGDQALELHYPGLRIELTGMEVHGPKQFWTVSNFSSLLLKRAMRMSGLLSETANRDRMAQLSDTIWRHLRDRRLGEGPGAGLWDQPNRVLPVDIKWDAPSWYHTQRVVECLVVAAEVVLESVPASDDLEAHLYELLAEAEQIFGQEKLRGAARTGYSIRDSFESVEKKLERARYLSTIRPGTAVTLVQDVLRELEKLEQARQTSGTAT